MTIIAIVTFAIGAALATVASVIDAREHRLPNKYTLPLVAVGLIGLSIASVVGDEPIRWAKMALGVGFFCGPWLLTHLISPSVIGFGDIKYSAGIGIFLGWLAPLIAMIGFFVAPIIYGIAYAARGDKTNKATPFGPALLAGAVIAVAVYPVVF